MFNISEHSLDKKRRNNFVRHKLEQVEGCVSGIRKQGRRHQQAVACNAIQVHIAVAASLTLLLCSLDARSNMQQRLESPAAKGKYDGSAVRVVRLHGLRLLLL